MELNLCILLKRIQDSLEDSRLIREIAGSLPINEKRLRIVVIGTQMQTNYLLNVWKFLQIS